MFSFVKQVIKSRDMIFSLSRNEIKQRYLGTSIGILWAILHPLSIIAVFWFVFSIGFKAVGPGNMPFLAYFLPGFIAWMFFSEVVNTSPQLILSKSYLIKKTVFPSEILPIINLLSMFWVHLLIIGISIIVVSLHGYNLTWKILLLPIPVGLLMLMALGISWLISSVNVFYRDAGQVIQVLTNIWFWMTPIVWSVDILPPTYQFIFDINPFHLIVEGYRFAFIDGYTFPNSLTMWLSALVFTICCLLIGGITFRRLKLEFADEM